MAKKKTTKKKSTKKKAGSRSAAGASKKSSSKKTSSRRAPGRKAEPINAEGKQLVIVESPAKARTINKYLGSDFAVAASVGHVRDLPTKAKKGQKQPVPGVDLEHDFEPTYEVLPDKKKIVSELKRAASTAADVWFATDLDREGEAIAWHLAQELGVDPERAKRVVFNAITKDEIEKAFAHPHRSTRPRSTPSRPDACSTASSATRSPPCSGRRSPAGSARAACSRSPSASSSSASARSRPSSRTSTGRSPRLLFTGSRATTLAAEWRTLLDSKRTTRATPHRSSRTPGSPSRAPCGPSSSRSAASPSISRPAARTQTASPPSPQTFIRSGRPCRSRRPHQRRGRTTDDPDGKGPAARHVTVTGDVDPAAPTA